MTSERLKRVTSKIEAAVERLSQLDPGASAPAGPSLFEGPTAEDQEKHRREIEDRDRRIAKLRADLDDISELKDQEIDRLRKTLDRPLKATEARGDLVSTDKHAALQRRYDRLKDAAQATQRRIDALIARMENGDG